MKSMKRLGIFIFSLFFIPSIQASALTVGDVNIPVVNSGDGLYRDEYNEGRYVYRGGAPNNYIMFNNELWRIVSIEKDGAFKILRNEILPDSVPFDIPGERATGYCSFSLAQMYGCNAWNKMDDFSGIVNNVEFSGVVEKDATLNSFLNGDYYNRLSENAKKYIVNHVFNVGPVFKLDNLAIIINNEKKYQWNGRIGLISASDFIQANSDMTNCGSFNTVGSECYDTNWMNGDSFWTITPSINTQVFEVEVGSLVGWFNLNSGSLIRPVVFLNSDISLSGNGTEDNPYIISLSKRYKESVDLVVNGNMSVGSVFNNIALPDDITWTSSDSSIAVVDSGKIIALREGNTVLTGISSDGVAIYEINVNVTSLEVAVPNTLVNVTTVIIVGIIIILVGSAIIVAAMSKKRT